MIELKHNALVAGVGIVRASGNLFMHLLVVFSVDSRAGIEFIQVSLAKVVEATMLALI
jgi:hypothetical protein